MTRVSCSVIYTLGKFLGTKRKTKIVGTKMPIMYDIWITTCLIAEYTLKILKNIGLTTEFNLTT